VEEGMTHEELTGEIILNLKNAQLEWKRIVR